MRKNTSRATHLSQWLRDRDNRRAIAVCVATSIMVVIALQIVSAISNVRVDRVVADPTAGGSIAVGSFSILGLAGWVAAAAFAAAVAAIERRGAGELTPRAQLFALVAAGSAWMWFDDAYQMHEEVIPDLLGVSENVVFALYACGAVAIAVRYRSLLRELSLYLWLAVAAFAVSNAVDVLRPVKSAVEVLPVAREGIEESFKLVAIAMLACFSIAEFARTLRQQIPIGAIERERADVESP